MPENQTSIELFFPFVILLSFLSNLPQCIEVKLNWRSTCADGRHPVPRSKYGQPSVSIPTFANQFSCGITNLHFCSAYNPWAQCVLTQGISIPHPETQTVDWVMLVTPGFCQATSRCTVDLHTDEKPQLMIDEKLQLTPFPQYKVAPQSPHIETFAWKWNWYLGVIINMLALVNECCGVNH